MSTYQKIAKGSEEWMFWQDYFQFHQDHYQINYPKELDPMIDDANKLYEKYKNTKIEQLVCSMLITLLSHEEDKVYKIGKFKHTESNEFVELKGE